MRAASFIYAACLKQINFHHQVSKIIKNNYFDMYVDCTFNKEMKIGQIFSIRMIM